MDIDALTRRIAEDMPRTVEELSRLVSIPSVSHAGHDPANVRASAELTRDLLQASGLENARLIELDGGHPSVFGDLAGPLGAPSILLYAHHDVQPEGEASAWTSAPYDPQVRDGRLYGRGAADDKAGLVMHLAALRALGAHEGSHPPVTIKVLIEGEEESSTEHLDELVGDHLDDLRADVVVVADGGNYRTGVPTVGTSVRGVTECTVTVTTLPRALHSGAYSAIPDAITALSRIIASLHDDDGEVTVAGLERAAWGGEPVDEAEFRDEARLAGDVRLLGSGPLADRLLSGPAISVIGLDAPTIEESSNQVVPTASAKISLRLAPDDDPGRARAALIDHVRRVAPWGVQIDVDDDGDERGHGYLVDTAHPAIGATERALEVAFGVSARREGSGGSVPFISTLTRAMPGVGVVIIGAGDERSNYHSIDESVDLADLRRMALAEVLMIDSLGEPADGP